MRRSAKKTLLELERLVGTSMVIIYMDGCDMVYSIETTAGYSGVGLSLEDAIQQAFDDIEEPEA
jgi:hypothetical protein